MIAHIEALGGTVTSVSGSGLVALFGAPESHEDDPERALRASFRIVSGSDVANGALSLRAGVETGRAVVGHIAGGSAAHYGAVGEVVGSAAALQRVARPGSVLVGPATRAATETLFEWGPSEEVAVVPGSAPSPLLTWAGPGRARSARPGASAASPAAGHWWQERPRFRCCEKPCGRRSRAKGAWSRSSANPASVKAAS